MCGATSSTSENCIAAPTNYVSCTCSEFAPFARILTTTFQIRRTGELKHINFTLSLLRLQPPTEQVSFFSLAFCQLLYLFNIRFSSSPAGGVGHVLTSVSGRSIKKAKYSPESYQSDQFCSFAVLTP